MIAAAWIVVVLLTDTSGVLASTPRQEHSKPPRATMVSKPTFVEADAARNPPADHQQLEQRRVGPRITTCRCADPQPEVSSERE